MGGDVGFDYVLVQYQPCPVCGHDTSRVPAGDLAAVAIHAASRWYEFLNTVCDHPGGVEELCSSGDDGAWCAVEYACHVRDLLALFGRRVELTLLADDPEYAWWDHEAAAAADHYAQQDPRAVADDIQRAAAELATLAQPLTAPQLARSGTSTGSVFTIDGLMRFSIHEALHHLVDARAAVVVVAA